MSCLNGYVSIMGYFNKPSTENVVFKGGWTFLAANPKCWFFDLQLLSERRVRMFIFCLWVSWKVYGHGMTSKSAKASSLFTSLLNIKNLKNGTAPCDFYANLLHVPWHLRKEWKKTPKDVDTLDSAWAKGWSPHEQTSRATTQRITLRENHPEASKPCKRRPWTYPKLH